MSKPQLLSNKKHSNTSQNTLTSCLFLVFVLYRVWINRFIILFNRTVLVWLHPVIPHGGHLMPTTYILSLFESVK